jgi:hypothetical protein
LAGSNNTSLIKAACHEVLHRILDEFYEAGHVPRTGQISNAYNVSFVKPDEMTQLGKARGISKDNE